MSKKIMSFVLFAAMSVITATAQDGPTMGWSSWNTFALNISESIINYIEVTPNVSTSIDNVQVSTSDEGQGQHLYDLQGREVKTDQARDIVISNNHKRILK